MTAQVRGHVHRAPAGWLHDEQLDQARRAREQQATLARKHALGIGRRIARPLAVAEPSLLDTEHRPVGQRCASADVWAQRAHARLELGCRALGIEHTIGG